MIRQTQHDCPANGTTITVINFNAQSRVFLTDEQYNLIQGVIDDLVAKIDRSKMNEFLGNKEYQVSKYKNYELVNVNGEYWAEVYSLKNP